MFKRSAAIICILIVLVSACIFPFMVIKGNPDPKYNSFGRGLSIGGDTYVYMDSGNGGYRLFSFDKNGKLLSLFGDQKHTASDIAFGDGKIYVLLNEGTRRDENGLIRSYRLRSFTTDLKVADFTVPFELHADEAVSDFDVLSGRLVVTAVATDAGSAEVYALYVEELERLYKDAHDSKDGEVVEPVVSADSIFLQKVDKGRFIADAAFSGNSLVLRTDADDPDVLGTDDSKLKSALSEVRLSFSEKARLSGNLLVYWFAVTAIIMILTVVIMNIFKGRSKMFYSGLILEFALVVLMVFFFFAYRMDSKRYVKVTREQYALNSLRVLAGEADGIEFKGAGADWYDSSEYRTMQRYVNRFVSRELEGGVIYDAFVIDSLTEKIVCSADGMNNVKAADRYGESNLWKALANSNPTDSFTLDIAGRNFEARAFSLKDSDRIRFVSVFDIANAGNDTAGILNLVKDLLILFVVASAGIVLVMMLISSDFKLFHKALRDVAINGKSPYLKPENPAGTDFSDMWNSLREIEKKIDKINYSSYKRYEAYFRFAPKKIEKILGKDSILDVASGDRVTLNGTLSVITNDPESGPDARITQLNGLLNFLNTHPEKEGVLVSDRQGLASADVLFTDDNVKTTEFAVDYLRDCREERRDLDRPAVFLYHGSFIYGVTGNEDQSKAYLLSRDPVELLKLADWLHKMRLGVVITEEIKERESGSFDCRYIGFINVSETGRSVKLYEVLDACPKKEREIKLVARSKFEQALKLFYQSDYYIARNSFSDLLKTNPEDELVRWYLFESERLLDSPPESSEKPGAIHID